MSAAGKGRQSRGPSKPNGASPSDSEPELVFLSYAREDGKFLKMLALQLKVLKNQGLIRIFNHQTLRTGALWREEAQSALSIAAVAILLVSPDYLASDDLMENELPQLLARAQDAGTAILPLLVRPSLFSTVEHLSRFKPFNPTDKTLVEMDRPGERERFLLLVAQEVQEEIRRRRAGSGDDRLL